jgi:hypothetical protein
MKRSLNETGRMVKLGTVGAVYQGVDELESSKTPLLASMQGGEFCLIQFIHAFTDRACSVYGFRVTPT